MLVGALIRQQTKTTRLFVDIIHINTHIKVNIFISYCIIIKSFVTRTNTTIRKKIVFFD